MAHHSQNGDTYLDIGGAYEVTAINAKSAVDLKHAQNSDTALGTLTSDVANVAWTNYSPLSTIVGWSSPTTKLIYYKKVGKLVFVSFSLIGVSDSTVATFTVPYTATNTVDIYFGGLLIWAQDNSVYVTGVPKCWINYNDNLVQARQDMPGTAWTASGTKQITGTIWFEATV